MIKTSNKLILILGILAFIFGLLLALPAYASIVTVDSGVIFNPYIQSPQYISNINQKQTTPTKIAGCDNRTTGFSIITGKSCIGNYINTSTTKKTAKSSNTNNSNTNNIPTSQLTGKTDGVYNNNVNHNNTVTSNNNENYGELTSAALLGSNSFMPSGLVQWILFVLLVLAIIFLWRYLYAEEKYMVEPVKHT